MSPGSFTLEADLSMHRGDWIVLLQVMTPVAQVIATVVLGAITVYIAHEQRKIAAQQRDVAAAKIKFDLFEKRLKVFDACSAIIVKVFTSKIERGDLMQFWRDSSSAAFLFGSDVAAYVSGIRDAATKYYDAEEWLARQPGPDERPFVVEMRTKALEHLTRAMDDPVAIFRPYLDLSHLK